MHLQIPQLHAQSKARTAAQRLYAQRCHNLLRLGYSSHCMPAIWLQRKTPGKSMSSTHRPLAQRRRRLLQQGVDLRGICFTQASTLRLHPPAQPVSRETIYSARGCNGSQCQQAGTCKNCGSRLPASRSPRRHVGLTRPLCAVAHWPAPAQPSALHAPADQQHPPPRSKRLAMPWPPAPAQPLIRRLLQAAHCVHQLQTCSAKRLSTRFVLQHALPCNRKVAGSQVIAACQNSCPAGFDAQEVGQACNRPARWWCVRSSALQLA